MKLIRKIRFLPFLTAWLLATHLIFNASLALATTELPEGVVAELAALDKKRQQAITEAREPLTTLDEKYVEALTRIRKTAQGTGELRKVLAVDEEVNRVRVGSKDEDAPTDAEVALLRKTYVEHFSIREREVAQKIADIDRLYASGLSEVVTKLTKAGMIKEAKHVLGLEQTVRQEIKQIDDWAKTPMMGDPPAATTKSIIGTTWRGPGNLVFTFMKNGYLSRDPGPPMHTYKVIGDRKVRIGWGKKGGATEYKEYNLNENLTIMTGIHDRTHWQRVEKVE